MVSSCEREASLDLIQATRSVVSSLVMVSSSSIVVVLADWFHLLGQLRAKCPTAPQLKQALLICPSMFVALLQKPPLPVPLPPLP